MLGIVASGNKAARLKASMALSARTVATVETAQCLLDSGEAENRHPLMPLLECLFTVLGKADEVRVLHLITAQPVLIENGYGIASGSMRTDPAERGEPGRAAGIVRSCSGSGCHPGEDRHAVERPSDDRHS
jgi:hypothetical protein